ncbi:bifunctional hydroxymethylpyrimidine kinase/phosphomethylpyrimidine kinase [Arenibaculum pallidiluteum]|uniref:bifunctional hydroxymethylpyrimidine kinase/phosphomethylpyrimidine kinase n=1 Tax=Arenibaculum pallidiluteum TaxID=2812559 RepID=UPI001A95E90B|nr:bifunctional hydroxymethylpyrimidine kinase/phosphomethylpyrimidine kinase [Arenibaculum pallidiluteum]
MKGRVLIAAGSDSGGGAGIQADIKAVTALNGFAMTAITALTAQNTQGVFGVLPVPPEFVAQQMRVVLDDTGADCVKTGMLNTPEVIEAIAAVLGEHPGIPLVVDPVMVAKGGDRLLQENAQQALERRLLPRAAIVTPNLPEAEVMTGLRISDVSGMREAARRLLAMGPGAVLLKGGHLPGDTLTDLLVTADGEERFSSRRFDSPHTHGTGCTLASAIAIGIAQGLELGEAVARARAYVVRAIETAPGFGKGHGPLNHAWPLDA